MTNKLNVTGSTSHVLADQLRAWADYSGGGEQLVYAIGTMSDAHKDLKDTKNLLRDTKNAARNLYDAGRVELCSKVLENTRDGQISAFIAIKRREVKPRPEYTRRLSNGSAGNDPDAYSFTQQMKDSASRSIEQSSTNSDFIQAQVI